MKIKCTMLLALLTTTSSIALAQEVQMHVLRDGVGTKSYAAAPRVLERLQLPPAVHLSPAIEVIPELLSALRVWNAEGRLPVRNGIIRPLGETMAVRFGGSSPQTTAHTRNVTTTTAGGLTWGTTIRVENAKRVRLHLENVELPAGATLWVYGSAGEAIAFDASLLDPERGLWTPSINGDTLNLEIEAPAGTSVSFQTKELLELLYARSTNPRPKTNDDPSCLANQDINCQTATEFPAISSVRRAIGQMEFVVPGGSAVCSGALINDASSSGAPYFLTANHCITGQTSASSLETYFDYLWESCVSTNADWLPPVRGATLVTTSASSDVSLLRLFSLPSNRVFLGWTTTAPGNGSKLHRVSHPVPDGYDEALPQMYSRTIVTTTSTTCPTLPRPNFLYSNESAGGEGAVYGGSSGSASILSDNANDARIAGQLLGACGPDPSAGCDRRNDKVDGAFSVSYGVLKPFLSPNDTTSACTQNASTICLMNDRFSVRLTYDIGQGPVPMTAIKYTANSGLFWFADATNIEVILKMVNACSLNNRYWVFVGGTTDVGVTATVTDTKAGTVKTYLNPRGTTFGTITDTSAFATCP